MRGAGRRGAGGWAGVGSSPWGGSRPARERARRCGPPGVRGSRSNVGLKRTRCDRGWGRKGHRAGARRALPRSPSRVKRVASPRKGEKRMARSRSGRRSRNSNPSPRGAPALFPGAGVSPGSSARARAEWAGGPLRLLGRWKGRGHPVVSPVIHLEGEGPAPPSPPVPRVPAAPGGPVPAPHSLSPPSPPRPRAHPSHPEPTIPTEASCPHPQSVSCTGGPCLPLV